MGTKNKNTKSAKIHESRAKVKRSRKARSQEFSRKSYIVFRKTILAVIVLAMMAVVLAVLMSFFNKPEQVVKSKIEEIAKDYYENYFYEKLSVDGLDRYVKTGFTAVPLRRLLIFDNRRHAEAEAVLYTYCDPDATTIKFYPEEPFGVKDYRAEYKYTCTF